MPAREDQGSRRQFKFKQTGAPKVANLPHPEDESDALNWAPPVHPRRPSSIFPMTGSKGGWQQWRTATLNCSDWRKSYASRVSD
jgi:hypothetical protein